MTCSALSICIETHTPRVQITRNEPARVAFLLLLANQSQVCQAFNYGSYLPARKKLRMNIDSVAHVAHIDDHVSQ